MSSDKLDVVPQGVSPPGRFVPTPEGELRARLDLGERPILLSVSAKRPHKNLARLLDAHARMPEASRPVLVVPGYATDYEPELTARAARLGTTGQVRFPHWIDGADLEGLYAAATAFVFPSLYEGFGLPVLEAMARGVPVACSDRSSLPEVAGDAALLFDPEDERKISAAVTRLLEDGSLRERLRRAGPAQAARFDWSVTASATLAVYGRALASRRR